MFMLLAQAAEVVEHTHPAQETIQTYGSWVHAAVAGIGAMLVLMNALGGILMYFVKGMANSMQKFADSLQSVRDDMHKTQMCVTRIDAVVSPMKEDVKSVQKDVQKQHEKIVGLEGTVRAMGGTK